MKYKILVVFVLISLGNQLIADNINISLSPQEDMFDDYESVYILKNPPLNYKNIAGEIIVGSVAGGIYLHKQQENIDNLGLAAVLVTFHLMITSGIVSGSTYMIGKIGDQTGSFLTAYKYSMGCGVGTWVAGMVVDKRNLKFSESILYYYLPGSVIGAVLGFNLTRRYDVELPSFLSQRNQTIYFGARNFQYVQSTKEYKLNFLEWRF